MKVVQIENTWLCFCVPIDNFEQMSQVTLACLLSTLSIFACETFHSIRFYERNIFHISWSFNFYCALIAANMREFKGNLNGRIKLTLLDTSPVFFSIGDNQYCRGQNNFCEVGATESSFWDFKTTWILGPRTYIR